MNIEFIGATTVIASGIVTGIFASIKYTHSRREKMDDRRLRMLEVALPELDKMHCKLRNNNDSSVEPEVPKSKIIIIEECMSQAYDQPLSIDEIIVLSKSNRPNFSFHGYSEFRNFLSISEDKVTRRPDLVRNRYKVPFTNYSISTPSITHAILLSITLIMAIFSIFFTIFTNPSLTPIPSLAFPVYLYYFLLAILFSGTSFLLALFVTMLVRNPTESQLRRMFRNILEENSAPFEVNESGADSNS